MKNNIVIVTTLWAGGWDDYEIDLNQTRLATQDEINQQTVRVAAGKGALPVIGGESPPFRGEWIWAYMISPKDRLDNNIEVPDGGIEAGQELLYKVIRHTGGGD